MNIKKRFTNKAFWVAMFSLVAITGQVFGIYEVPDGYENWVNAVLVMLSALGVFVDTSSPGISDK